MDHANRAVCALNHIRSTNHKWPNAQTPARRVPIISIMSDIFAMQRANGDVFALDDHGRFCVPLFHSTSDAMTARLRNGEMLLFKPVALNTKLLRELAPKGGQNNVDLLLVNDPLRSLKRGSLVAHAELVMLVTTQG